MQLEAARGRADAPSCIRPELLKSADSARNMVTQMREVIWSINPQCDTLDSFCACLSEFAVQFLHSAGLRCRLDLPIEPPHRELAAGARYHLILVVKEALHNAAKHAHASEVRIRLTVRPDDLVLTISDDGSGFPPGTTPGIQAPAMPTTRTPDTEGRRKQGLGGRGMLNMRRRMDAVHGKLIIETKPGAGTTVVVQAPLPRPS